jgi:hypothetical protein
MEIADQKYATQAATYLLASFPHQPHEPEVFLKQLVLLFAGRPKILLRQISDPSDGILAKLKDVPSLAEVREWLITTPYGGPMRITHRKEPEPEKVITPEDHARMDARWAKTKPLLQAASEKMRINKAWDGKKRLDWKQVDNPELRADALEFLEEMRGK